VVVTDALNRSQVLEQDLRETRQQQQQGDKKPLEDVKRDGGVGVREEGGRSKEEGARGREDGAREREEKGRAEKEDAAALRHDREELARGEPRPDKRKGDRDSGKDKEHDKGKSRDKGEVGRKRSQSPGQERDGDCRRDRDREREREREREVHGDFRPGNFPPPPVGGRMGPGSNGPRPMQRLPSAYPEDAMEWYYVNPNGAEEGPFTIEMLRQWATALAKREEMQEEYENYMSVRTYKEEMAQKVVLRDLLNNNRDPKLLEQQGVAMPGVVPVLRKDEQQRPQPMVRQPASLQRGGAGGPGMRGGRGGERSGGMSDREGYSSGAGYGTGGRRR
jgi:hypothetical protein